MNVIKTGVRNILVKARLIVWVGLSFCSAREIEFSSKVSKGITYAWLHGFWQSSLDVTKLKIGGCKLANFVSPRLENLQSLIINGSDFQEIDLTSLINLIFLDIHWCPSLTTLKLAGLNKLKNIYLYNGESLEHLELPKLSSLTIERCNQLSGICFLDVKGLERLHIKWCNEFGWLELANFATLKSLLIEWCPRVGFDLSRLVNLTSLTLAGCDCVNLDLSDLFNLSSLSLTRCINLQPSWPQKLTSLQLREYSNLNWSAHDLPLSLGAEKIIYGLLLQDRRNYAEHRRAFIKIAKDLCLIRRQVGNSTQGEQHLFTALLPVLMRYLHGSSSEGYFAKQMIGFKPLQIEQQGLKL